jgi:hypothetical protein
MTSQTNSQNDFERFMLETMQADQCRVQDRTPVDAETLMAAAAPASASWLWRMASMAAPMAACIALFFGVSRVWVTGPGATTPATSLNGGAVATVSYCFDLPTFADCFTGPGGDPLSTECACVDYDQDGDVDFADFGALQREAPGSAG